MDALIGLATMLEVEATRLMDLSRQTDEPERREILREQVKALDSTGDMILSLMSGSGYCMVQGYTTDPCDAHTNQCHGGEDMVYVPLVLHHAARRRFIDCPLVFEDQCSDAGGVNGIYLPICGDAFPTSCPPIMEFCEDVHGKKCDPIPDCVSFICRICGDDDDAAPPALVEVP